MASSVRTKPPKDYQKKGVRWYRTKPGPKPKRPEEKPLTDAERNMLQLRLEGLTIAEAAKETGRTLSTVRSTLNTARRKLEFQLERRRKAEVSDMFLKKCPDTVIGVV